MPATNKENVCPAWREELLSLAVVYGDSLSLEWASQVCHRAVYAANLDTIQFTCWQSQALANPSLRRRAVQSASLADMIVVALKEHGEVPPELRVWTEEWLPQRRQNWGALVALVGHPEPTPPAPSPIAAYLRTIAARANLDYFTQELQYPQEPNLYYRAMIAERVLNLTSSFRSSLDRTGSRHQPTAA